MQEEDLLKAKTFRDRISTVTSKGKRNWIYASKPTGKWYNRRKILAYVYFAIFFILPWVSVNNMPFILFNITEGKFIIFSKIFWPQDFFIFALAMITFIISVVLFTIIYGRLFCGWICPQTVFLEFIYRPIEWLIEGSDNAQKKLHAKKWNLDKIIKKVSKHVIYLIISFAISHTFLAYILGVNQVLKMVHEPIENQLGLFLGLLIFTLLFYSVFAFVRDIVCTTVCPYGRLQGVMFDKDTMQIAYDYNRGEPRGKINKKEKRELGDCIDCNKCVTVCPTGIDIRNGLQMECVSCAACIDSCNEVMKAIHKPQGLIRYASKNELSTGIKFRFNKRMQAYTVLLFFLVGILLYFIFSRKDLDVMISKVKGQLYQEMPNNAISNLFELKCINKTYHSKNIELKLENISGKIRMVGNSSMVLKKESLHNFIFFVDINKNKLEGMDTEIKFGLYENGKRVQIIATSFLGPYKEN